MIPADVQSICPTSIDLKRVGSHSEQIVTTVDYCTPCSFAIRSVKARRGKMIGKLKGRPYRRTPKYGGKTSPAICVK